MEQHLFFNPGFRPFGPYPLLRPALAYILGILLVHYLPFSLPSWLLPIAAGGVLLSLLITILFKKNQAAWLVSAHQSDYAFFLLLVLFALLGAWNYRLWQVRQPIPFVTPDNVSLRFVLMDTPAETRFGKKEVHGILFLTSPFAPQGHLLRWESSMTQLQNLQKGDTIFFEGPVLPFPRPSCPGAFDQRAFYNKKGILSYSLLTERHLIAIRKGKYQPGLIEKIRLFSINKTLRYFKDEEVRGIVLQMLLGLRADLDEETKEAFRNTGVMHILAVSGLHVGIIYLVLSAVIGVFFRRGSPGRIIAVAFVLSFVWFYAVLAGFRPSVVRASLMLSFIAAGEVFRRQIPLLNSLSAAALLNLIWKPEDVFDLGFLLSYAAVAGIALLYRPMYNLWKAPAFLNRLWELTCLSVSAQAGTLGITLVHFGQFPVLFILANWVAVPAAGLTIYSALLFLLAPWPYVSKLLAVWLEIFVSTILDFLKGLDRLPYSSLKNLWFHPVEGLMITFLIFSLFHVLVQPGYKTVKRFLAVLLVWQAYLLSQDIADLIFPGKLIVCGGKEAGVYVKGIQKIQPMIKFNDAPPEAGLIRLRRDTREACIILKARSRDSCSPNGIIVWNDNKILKKGVFFKAPQKGELIGPAIGIRKALEIKRLMKQSDKEIHAVNIDGYATL